MEQACPPLYLSSLLIDYLMAGRYLLHHLPVAVRIAEEDETHVVESLPSTSQARRILRSPTSRAPRLRQHRQTRLPRTRDVEARLLRIVLLAAPECPPQRCQCFLIVLL